MNLLLSYLLKFVIRMLINDANWYNGSKKDRTIGKLKSNFQQKKKKKHIGNLVKVYYITSTVLLISIERKAIQKRYTLVG